MLYDPKVSPATTLTGRNIAHAKRATAERALVAADLHLNRAALTRPTIGQVAILLKVSRAYVAAAVAIADNVDLRAEVTAGRCPLMVAAIPGMPEETLATHFARSTLAERIEAAREIGVSVIWDQMLNPLL